MAGTHFSAPLQQDLNRLYMKAVKSGLEIRYADENTLIVWERNQPGCLVALIFWTLVFVTLGLALIFGVLSALDKNGTLTTYTLQNNGKIKTEIKRNVP